MVRTCPASPMLAPKTTPSPGPSMLSSPASNSASTRVSVARHFGRARRGALLAFQVGQDLDRLKRLATLCNASDQPPHRRCSPPRHILILLWDDQSATRCTANSSWPPPFLGWFSATCEVSSSPTAPTDQREIVWSCWSKSARAGLGYHPSTLNTSQSVGSSPQSGTGHQAIALAQHAYDGRAKTLGPGHPSPWTLSSTSPKSAALTRRYTDSSNTFNMPATHSPDTRPRPRRNPAATIWPSPEKGRSPLRCHQTLRTGRDDRVKHIGVDHPATLITLGNLGTVYMRMGKHSRPSPLSNWLSGTIEASKPDHRDALNLADRLATAPSRPPHDAIKQ